jgi:SAM-dependent methyltransferase
MSVMHRFWNFVRQVKAGAINRKMLRYHLGEQFRGHSRNEGNDDFNWSRYSIHYQGELELGSQTRSLTIAPEDYLFRNGCLVHTSSQLPLHPNVHTIYETILQLQPRSVLEVGCGGGDNLFNLFMLQPSLHLRGVDISPEQLNLLTKRHPRFAEMVEPCDITQSVSHIAPADLVFTQAVLMHIGIHNGRWDCGIKNLFHLANHQIVLMEHWFKHDYFALLSRLTPGVDIPWPSLHLYTRPSTERLSPPVLIASRHQLSYKPLQSPEQLLAYSSQPAF